jgi:hypothetical protein
MVDTGKQRQRVWIPFEFSVGMLTQITMLVRSLDLLDAKSPHVKCWTLGDVLWMLQHVAQSRYFVVVYWICLVLAGL